jgi:ABC transporter substrate binding protein
VKRREFITLLGGGAAAWPLVARAQQPRKMARLGYLAPASNPDLMEALRDGLRELGYVEGRNLAIEYRFALGQAKTDDELAAELVRLSPDAIVIVGTPPALAAKRQTKTIPIIMAPAGDPLPLGLAASLARLGGNVTGVTLYASELASKRMEVFREAVVGIRRIAVLGNAGNPLHPFIWDELQSAGRALGLEFRLLCVGSQRTSDRVFLHDAGRLPCPDSLIRCAVLLGAETDQHPRCNASTSRNVRGTGFCPRRRPDFLWAEYPGSYSARGGVRRKGA